VGRSSLLASLTNAEPEVSSTPYTTQRPVLGMLQYQDIQFQLIETPALVEGAAEGRMEGPRILGLARNADGLILMVDLTQGSAIQFETLRSELEKSGVLVERPEGFVDIERRSFGSGVQVVGGGVLVDCTVDDIRRLLSSYRINSARVRIRGKVSLDDIEDSLFSSTIYKPTMIIANKIDVEGVEKDLFSLEEVIKRNIPLFSVSCKSKQGLEKIGEHLFRMLKIIRVYSKEPSAKEPSKKPMIVEEGSRVIDVARKLHSELYRRFKYARIWGPSAKYPGERVGQEHMMMDGDILEVH